MLNKMLSDIYIIKQIWTFHLNPYLINLEKLSFSSGHLIFMNIHKFKVSRIFLLFFLNYYYYFLLTKLSLFNQKYNENSIIMESFKMFSLWIRKKSIYIYDGKTIFAAIYIIHNKVALYLTNHLNAILYFFCNIIITSYNKYFFLMHTYYVTEIRTVWPVLPRHKSSISFNKCSSLLTLEIAVVVPCRCRTF